MLVIPFGPNTHWSLHSLQRRLTSFLVQGEKKDLFSLPALAVAPFLALFGARYTNSVSEATKGSINCREFSSPEENQSWREALAYGVIATVPGMGIREGGSSPANALIIKTQKRLSPTGTRKERK